MACRSSRGRKIDRNALRLACELHDVGKIRIPEAILNKRGALTPEEYAEIQLHPITGRQILEPLLDDPTLLAVVAWHHDRGDGTGYPDGLQGEAIPMPARVVALVIALDAMTSDRSYRGAIPWDQAVREIHNESGTAFDPRLLDAFDRALPRMRRIHDSRASRRSTSTTSSTFWTRGIER